jgi:small subunit ribosomal protein S17
MSKIKIGIVISNKSEKTATVRVDRMVPHKKYNKRYRVSKKFAVHDENNQAQIGETVTIREIPPMSKTKHWELVMTDSSHPDTPTTKKTRSNTDVATDKDSS